ncbi:GTP-binding protein [Rhodobacter sp. 24-YEA-8]|uniref:CobW family GTP-binding protein n=1 Tax=Rhodobacter sp. 24-YEA-8 TaxID=1884310 RepID=UPI000897BD91|nr:GTP-binding protein [Rhodobacter sp. 24-YEA-8]SEC43798.1 GTPase, G3E family [Rhodobacter sp. 24-YEA-8]
MTEASIQGQNAKGDGLLPLTILGGFLGAGKSSWLRHQLHQGLLRDQHIIVNEAAGTPVDNLLLGKATRLTVLAGGCACCEGLTTLIATLRDICDQASGQDAGKTTGILLETSGLADPGVIASAIAADPILARRLRLSEIIVLADAQHGTSQLMEEPLARAQAETADRIIMTKTASAPPDQTARLLATLRLLNPGARIEAAELGIPRDLPEPGQPYALPAARADTPDAPIRPFRLTIGGASRDDDVLGWVALSTWLSALLFARGKDVIRVKGVVRTPAGRLLLQSVRHVMQPPEILPEIMPETFAGPQPEEGVIVLIGRNFDAGLIAQSWARFGG